jgi:predicted helicase
MTQLEPRNHQVAALAALQRTFTAHERAQLVMACGTGKTLIGRWHAEQVNPALTLAVVPSPSLVAQTLAERRSATAWEFEPFVVCSDQSTAQGPAERATRARTSPPLFGRPTGPGCGPLLSNIVRHRPPTSGPRPRN